MEHFYGTTLFRTIQPVSKSNKILYNEYFYFSFVSLKRGKVRLGKKNSQYMEAIMLMLDCYKPTTIYTCRLQLHTTTDNLLTLFYLTKFIKE